MINIYRIKPTAITAATLLNGCRKTGNIDRAEKIWNEVIIKYKIRPTFEIYLAMIQIYGQYGDVDKSRSYYDAIQSQGIKHNLKSHTAMMRAYLVNGQIEHALEMKSQVEKHWIVVRRDGT